MVSCENVFVIMFFIYCLVTGLCGFIFIWDITIWHWISDIRYLETCPKATCNGNYIGEAKRQIFETVKDHNGRDFKSHFLKHALEDNRQHLSEKYFKIIVNGFRGNSKKRKVAEVGCYGVTNSINQTNSKHSKFVDPIAII